MSNDVCTIGSVVVGVCQAKAPGHPRNFTGVWVTGSAILSINGEPAVCENDIGVTDCGHTLIAISGSSTGSSLHNNLHRAGDLCIVAEGGVGVSVDGVTFNSSD